MRDGPAATFGAYSGPPHLPHRSSRLRRDDLEVRNTSNEIMPTGSAAMVVRRIGHEPRLNA